MIMEEIADIFVAMGWEIADGPELETEWFNFDALNFAPDHPARAMQDTFYVDDPDGAAAVVPARSGMVLRDPHLAGAGPHHAARNRRRSTWPAPAGSTAPTNSTPPTPRCSTRSRGWPSTGHLSMAHLKGTLDHFARAMFGPESRTRLRPSFFPFTEPSAEMDVWFPEKKGGAGWVEWGGCGMVDPNVLRACGIDPTEWSGFAFGMGVDRTLQFRNGIVRHARPGRGRRPVHRRRSPRRRTERDGP